MRRNHRRRGRDRDAHEDRGSIDVSIEMMFGTIGLLLVLALLFEATAFWHARNILDDAASDGVRVAAAYDGTCAEGIAVARTSIKRQARSWANAVDVTCTAGPVVTVTVRGRTPGMFVGSLGLTAQVSESAPKER